MLPDGMEKRCNLPKNENQGSKNPFYRAATAPRARSQISRNDEDLMSTLFRDCIVEGKGKSCCRLAENEELNRSDSGLLVSASSPRCPEAQFQA